jgi:hypothetical protein
MGRTHTQISSLVRFVHFFLSLTETQKQFILKHPSPEQVLHVREIISNLLYNKALELDTHSKTVLKSNISKLLSIISNDHQIVHLKNVIFPKNFKIIIIALQTFMTVDGISEILPH